MLTWLLVTKETLGYWIIESSEKVILYVQERRGAAVLGDFVKQSLSLRVEGFQCGRRGFS